MRIEATTDEWKQLYELAARFQEQKAWEWLTPKDFFAFETDYLSISGNDVLPNDVLSNGSRSCGFSIYFGLSGLNSLLGFWEGEALEIEPEYLLAEQNVISMVISDKENLPPEQAALLAQLDLQFEESNWIYFERHEPGYAVYPLNQSEVQYTIRCLTWLLEALSKRPKQLPPDRQPAETLYCYKRKKDKSSKRKDSENGEFEALPIQHFQFPSIAADDSKQVWILQNTKQSKEVWELDYCPFAKGHSKEGYEKPVRPWAFFLANRTERLPITSSLIFPGDAADSPARLLSEQIIELGRPRELIVPNALVRSQVATLCKNCNIQITIRDTPYCWRHIAELEKEAHTTFDNQEEDKDDDTKEFFAKLSFQEQKLSDRAQKIQAVKDFFGQGSMTSDEYDAIEKSIETAWSDQEWKEHVAELSRAKLLEFLSDRSWKFQETTPTEELAEIYMEQKSDSLFHFKRILDGSVTHMATSFYADLHKDDITKKRLPYHYPLFEDDTDVKQRGWTIEKFYYSADEILQLFDRALIDIGLLTREHDWILVIKLFPELDDVLYQAIRW